MKKDERKKVLDGLEEMPTELLSQDEMLSDIGGVILKLVEKNHTEKLERERKESDKKIEKVKEDLTNTISSISRSLSEFKKSVEEDSSLQEVSEYIDLEIEEIEEQLESLKETISEISYVSDKRHEDYGKSLMSLSTQIKDISKTVSEHLALKFKEIKRTHDVFDEDVKSLHKGHTIHLEKFEQIDKNFLKFEKDLKKYASEIYEYGSSFSILSNGSLIGTSNALNLKAGANMTITVTVNPQGAITAQFDASGSALAIIAVTGTIDDSNTSFTSATLPTLLNINGAFYKQTGGAITWSRSGTTITLSSAVGVGGSIFGI